MSEAESVFPNNVSTRYTIFSQFSSCNTFSRSFLEKSGFAGADRSTATAEIGTILPERTGDGSVVLSVTDGAASATESSALADWLIAASVLTSSRSNANASESSDKESSGACSGSITIPVGWPLPSNVRRRAFLVTQYLIARQISFSVRLK